MAGLLNKYQQTEENINVGIENYLDQCRSKNTRRQYDTNLRLSFDDLFGFSDYSLVTVDMVESLTPHILNMYKNDLVKSGKYTNSTINNRLIPLKKLIEFLSGYGMIIYAVSGLSLVKELPDDREEIEMIPFEEAMRYIKYTEENLPNGFEKSMVLSLALDTGLRLEEVMKLKWNQFKVDGNVVVINSTKENRGKGNDHYLDKIDLDFYNELLTLKNESDKLFSMSSRTMERVIEDLNKVFGNLNEEGKGLYSFHSIKKTCVTMVYRRTGCILQAQKKARHKSIETTRRYLRVEDIEITGMISIMKKSDDNLYKEASQESLLRAIEKLPYEAKILLNSHLKEN